MDKLDFKILKILDWNARTPINKIAKKVKSNKDVVAYRIKKLEEEEIITNYYPVLDMHKLGYQTSRLYFDLEEIDEDKKKEFISFLDKDIKAGLIFWHNYPPYTCGVFLWTKTFYEIESKLVRIKRHLGKFLIKYNYTIISTYRQYPKDYLFDKKTHDTFRSLEPIKEVDYDEKDYKILKELAINGRASTVKIAQKLKIPQTTVSHKIKNLEKKKIILGYRAQLNMSKLKYSNYLLEIYLEENTNLKEIETWANTHKNIVWFQKIIGTCDLELEIEVKNRDELDTYLNILRKKFPNIRKIIFWSQQYKKLTFLP